MFFFYGWAVVCLNGLVLFVVEFALGLSNADFLWFVFAQYLSGIVLLPVVVMLSNKIGRHKALAIGAALFFAVLPFFLTVEKGNFTHALILFLLIGPCTTFLWGDAACLDSGCGGLRHVQRRWR